MWLYAPGEHHAPVARRYVLGLASVLTQDTAPSPLGGVGARCNSRRHDVELEAWVTFHILIRVSYTHDLSCATVLSRAPHRSATPCRVVRDTEVSCPSPRQSLHIGVGDYCGWQLLRRHQQHCQLWASRPAPSHLLKLFVSWEAGPAVHVVGGRRHTHLRLTNFCVDNFSSPPTTSTTPTSGQTSHTCSHMLCRDPSDKADLTVKVAQVGQRLVVTMLHSNIQPMTCGRESWWLWSWVLVDRWRRVGGRG